MREHEKRTGRLVGSDFVVWVFVEELLKQNGHRITVLNRGKIPVRRHEVREIV